MHHSMRSAATVAVALLAAVPAVSAGLYPKNSPVLQVDAKDYDRLIGKSNYTSIVEFYAPWCGHCQSLKPAYEKAAKNLAGLANVAAVNCDDDANKAFCGQMGVQGFPTLKIVRPAAASSKSDGKKKSKRPAVEDYQGPRTAAGIVDAVVERINNHVKRVTDKDLDSFLAEKNETAKAILFSDKGTTTALLKGVAIDFLDVITVAQVRNKESRAVEMFGIEKYPTLVLLPGGGQESIVYDGELKKEAIVEFLSRAGAPNQDPAPTSGKKADKKDKTSNAKAKAADEDADAKPAEPEEPITAEAPAATPVPPIPELATKAELVKECLHDGAHICVLAIVSSKGERSAEATSTLADIAHKHAQSKRKLFPIFEVAAGDTTGAAELVKALGLGDNEVELIAVNARRGWWRQYAGADFAHENLQSWIDAIRMSEGEKKKLPEGLVVAAEPQPTPEAAPAPEPTEDVKSETEEETRGADPTVDPKTEGHDEL